MLAMTKTRNQEHQPLKVAAIGVGSLGRHHARNYAELAREGRVSLHPRAVRFSHTDGTVAM